MGSEMCIRDRAWWTANEGELGFYHPKKWRKLIELDPIFAIEDAFVGTGVDMTKKSQILRIMRQCQMMQ